jgi:hypothetical protein
VRSTLPPPSGSAQALLQEGLLTVTGRHRKDAHGEGGISFDFNGVSVGAAFTGLGNINAVMRKVGQEPDFFVVYCDGVFQGRGGQLNESSFDTTDWPVAQPDDKHPGPPQIVPLCSGLDPSARHTVSVFKSTEPQFNSLKPSPNYVTLLSFQDSDADAKGGGGALRIVGPPPSVATATITAAGSALTVSGRRVEFLGDSE